MADRLGAEQGLKAIQRLADMRFRRSFPVGRAAWAWQIAASNRAAVGWREAFPQRPFRYRGEIRHVASVDD
jgi:hypothetical protein